MFVEFAKLRKLYDLSNDLLNLNGFDVFSLDWGRDCKCR